MMIKHTWMRMLSVVVLAVLLTAALGESHKTTSTFNPGTHPATPASIAAEDAAEEAWFGHVKFLASDDLKGRKTGTPKFLKAVAYVEDQFKAIGLKPAGVDGFRQAVGVRSAIVDSEYSAFDLVRANTEPQIRAATRS